MPIIRRKIALENPALSRSMEIFRDRKRGAFLSGICFGRLIFKIDMKKLFVLCLSCRSIFRDFILHFKRFQICLLFSLIVMFTSHVLSYDLSTYPLIPLISALRFSYPSHLIHFPNFIFLSSLRPFFNIFAFTRVPFYHGYFQPFNHPFNPLQFQYIHLLHYLCQTYRVSYFESIGNFEAFWCSITKLHIHASSLTKHIGQISFSSDNMVLLISKRRSFVPYIFFSFKNVYNIENFNANLNKTRTLIYI